MTVSLHTHALGGLSINDFIVAAHSDKVPVTYSKKWLEANEHVVAGRQPATAAIPATAAALAASESQA